MWRRLRDLLPNSKSERRRAWIILGTGFFVVVAVSIIFWLLPQTAVFRSTAAFQQWIQHLGPWAPVVIILYEILQVLIPPLPGQVLDVVNGYVFGPWYGALYSLLGVSIGSMIALGLARRYGRPLLHIVWPNLTNHQLHQYLGWRRWWLWVFLLWVPGAPDDAISYILGFTQIPWPTALGIIALGRFPQIVLSVVLGANLHFVSPWYFLFGVVFATLLFWIFSKTRRAQR